MSVGKAVLFTVAGLAGVFVLSLLWGISINNDLVRWNESTKSAWSQVENQYQRRADLIPNLVETVKGYMGHERQTLEAVVKARASATQVVLQPQDLKDESALRRYEKAQGELSHALGRLLAVSENYPHLKANENFLTLQAQLEGTENRIAVERKRFNDVVQAYNSQIAVFPHSLIASLRGFSAKPYFQATAGAQTVPSVKFSSP